MKINEKATDLLGIFGYTDGRQFQQDALENRKLGALVALVQVLAEKLDDNVALGILTTIEILTGRELEHGIGSMVKYLYEYLNEDEVVEYSARMIKLSMRGKYGDK
jgi:hypothetical protein